VRIYFSGSIAGGREELPIYQHVVARLKSLGHVVLTEHVADPNVLSRERDVPAREVYRRDANWLNGADVVIAEISRPSLGVGYEIGYALQRETPTLCVYRDGLFVSKMITGNPSPFLTLAAYRDESELDRHVDAFLIKRAARQPRESAQDSSNTAGARMP
jgi:nucleoside 2-deoxyribosyltransferase